MDDQDFGTKLEPVIVTYPVKVGVIVIDRPEELLPSLFILCGGDCLHVLGRPVKSFEVYFTV